jgi:organic radical activating enzyme
MKFKIPRLLSGGLIVNYACSSKCGHCHYNSSPQREKDYINVETAKEIFLFLKRNGCHSVHIGGGEPFLQIEKLKDILKVAQEEHIHIEYIETNSTWFKTEQQTIEVLQELQNLNVNMLLISISPLHNEYIPFQKVEGLINACQKQQVSVFPWIKDFAPDIAQMDKTKTHSLEEYKELFGDDYKENIISRYGLSIGGRAIETFRDSYADKDYKDILKEQPPCSSYFTDTSHFHIDLYGKYIPRHCVGFQFDIEDVENEIDGIKYPFSNIIYRQGIKGAFEYATNAGFNPKNSYISACEMCEDIRNYLLIKHENDIGPIGFYKEIKTRGK